MPTTFMNESGGRFVATLDWFDLKPQPVAGTDSLTTWTCLSGPPAAWRRRGWRRRAITGLRKQPSKQLGSQQFARLAHRHRCRHFVLRSCRAAGSVHRLPCVLGRFSAPKSSCGRACAREVLGGWHRPDNSSVSATSGPATASTSFQPNPASKRGLPIHPVRRRPCRESPACHHLAQTAEVCISSSAKKLVERGEVVAGGILGRFAGLDAASMKWWASLGVPDPETPTAAVSAQGRLSSNRQL